MARSRICAFLMKPMLWSHVSIRVPILISNILKRPLLWRFLGISSSTIGLLCYCLSSSFQHLYGKWNFLKIILYCVVSLIISCIMLFPEKLQSWRSFRLKSHAVFLVLILTSLYSVFYDKAVNGKPDVLSLISNGAFALMSLSLSRQVQLGFESGLCNFFLGCFVVQLIKINLILTSVVAVFCYLLIALCSCKDFKLKIGHVSEDDQFTIEIGTINEASFDNLESIEMVPMQEEARVVNSLRRRSNAKKVVFKVGIFDEKAKTKAMKAVSGISEVESVSIDMKEKELTLTGDIDPVEVFGKLVEVVGKLRKLCRYELISVGPAKEEKKKEEPKKQEPKKEEAKKKDPNDISDSSKVGFPQVWVPPVRWFYP